MPKIYCQHKNHAGVVCPNACMEYDRLQIVVKAKHRTIAYGNEHHENRVDLIDILEMAVADGDGQKILAEVLRLMGKESLTEVFGDV